MLAGAQGGDDLVRMQRGGRDEEDGVQARMGQQGVVVGIAGGDAELAGGPVQFGRHGAAGGDDFGIRHALRQVDGVALAQPAQADDADF